MSWDQYKHCLKHYTLEWTVSTDSKFRALNQNMNWGLLLHAFLGSEQDKSSTEVSTPTKQVCIADSKPPLTVDKVYAIAAPLRWAHYESANLDEIISNITHLTTYQKTKILASLKTHQIIFERHHGDWKGEVVALQLKPDAKPYYAWPYLIPLNQLHATKHDVYCQCDIGAMWQLMGKKAEQNKRAFAAFEIDKRMGKIWHVIHFCKLNQQLETE